MLYLATLLTFKGISLQLACPCQGHSLGKGWLHTVCSPGKAGHGWHRPAAQPLQPLGLSHDSHFREQLCSTALWISAPSGLKKRNIGFNLEVWGLYKFCLTTNSTQDQQFLKTKLSLCGCTILTTKLQVLPDLPPLIPRSTTLIIKCLLSEAAQQCWSDLASQTCFGR